MRKFLSSLLVAFYLILTSGVVVHLHYCMDRLAAVGLFASDHKDACDDCGMDMTEANDCCHDRTDVIKLKQDQTSHSSLVANFKKSTSRTAFNLAEYGVNSAHKGSAWLVIPAK